MVKCPHAASGCNYPEGDCPGHCASKQQPYPLRLADDLQSAVQTYPQMSEDEPGSYRRLEDALMDDAAAELRRLYKENADFRATCDHLTRENAEQIGEIVSLKEQRDELLEAAKQMHAWVSVLLNSLGAELDGFELELSNSKTGQSVTLSLKGQFDKASAAIAKAGGAA